MEAQTFFALRMRFIAGFLVICGLATPWLLQASPTSPKKMLSCSPTVVRPGSELTLHFAMPHPAELAVVAPDGTWFFLVYEPAGEPAEKQPLADKASFQKMTDMHFDISGAKAAPWIYGRNSKEPIFSQPGKYRFVLSDVLGTDAPRVVYECTVTLKIGK